MLYALALSVSRVRGAPKVRGSETLIVSICIPPGHFIWPKLLGQGRIEDKG